MSSTKMTRVADLKPGMYIDASLLAEQYLDNALPSCDFGIVNHVTDEGSGNVFLRSSAFSGTVRADDRVVLV